MTESCHGNYLNEPTPKCERLCDKNEQSKCFEEYTRRERELERAKTEKIKPWYLQGEDLPSDMKCDKCG